MKRPVLHLIWIVFMATSPAMSHEAVRGIPSAVIGICSDGNGNVAAQTAANRFYLSRDHGRTFNAIDTADAIREPWLSDSIFTNHRLPMKTLMHFDGTNGLLWIRSIMGGILCRYNLDNGVWDTPFIYDSACSGPAPYHQGATISCMAIGSKSQVAVVVQAGQEGSGCEYVMWSEDAGDHWVRLPDLYPGISGYPSNIGGVEIGIDGSVVVSVSGSQYLPMGIYRLENPSSAWTYQKKVKPVAGTILIRTPEFIYANSSDSLHLSRDNGITFTSLGLPFESVTSYSRWRGDTIALTGFNSSSEYSSLALVVDTTTVYLSQVVARHDHVVPFITAVEDNKDPLVFISGNGATKVFHPFEQVAYDVPFHPETYRAPDLEKIGSGLATYVDQHGIYRIDETALAHFDSAATFALRTVPQDLWGSDSDDILLNMALNIVHSTMSGMDTIINKADSAIGFPVLQNDSVIYAGTNDRGLWVIPLDSALQRRYITEGLPHVETDTNEALLGSDPIGFADGSVISLASYGDHSKQRIASTGGVFIVDSTWTRVNDDALGLYRLLFPAGNQNNGIIPIIGYDQYGGPRLQGSVTFVYHQNSQTVMRVSGFGDSAEYFSACAFDSNHVAMIGLGHSLLVRDLRTMSGASIRYGAMYDVSEMNGQIALSTREHGIILVTYDTTSTEVHLSDVASTQCMEVWPNPASERLFIQLAATSENVHVELFTARGVLTYDNYQPPSDIGAALTLDTSVLPSGAYILRVSNATTSCTEMVMISR